jgi:hypothetical protein
VTCTASAFSGRAGISRAYVLLAVGAASGRPRRRRRVLHPLGQLVDKKPEGRYVGAGVDSGTCGFTDGDAYWEPSEEMNLWGEGSVLGRAERGQADHPAHHPGHSCVRGPERRLSASAARRRGPAPSP